MSNRIYTHYFTFFFSPQNQPTTQKTSNTDHSVLFCQFITLWKKEDHSADMVKLLAILFRKCCLEVYILQNNITPGRLCGKIQYSVLTCGGGGLKERERSISHSSAQLQAEGGMGPGTADFCVEEVHGVFLRLSRDSLFSIQCVWDGPL